MNSIRNYFGTKGEPYIKLRANDSETFGNSEYNVMNQTCGNGLAKGSKAESDVLCVD